MVGVASLVGLSVQAGVVDVVAVWRHDQCYVSIKWQKQESHHFGHTSNLKLCYSNDLQQRQLTTD